MIQYSKIVGDKSTIKYQKSSSFSFKLCIFASIIENSNSMNKLLKVTLSILLIVAYCYTGCKKPEDPSNGGNNGNSGETPEAAAIVSTSEVQYDGKVFVEAVFEDETKMYFAIISPTEVSVASGEFFYQDDPSQAYKYRGDVVIPEKITHLGTTYSIIEIGWKAFYGCNLVSSVYMPNTITTISSYYNYPNFYPHHSSDTFGAFQGCSNLNTIQMSTNIVNIGDMAFSGCPCFSGTVNIPKYVKSIGKAAFDSKSVCFNADSCFVAGDMEPSNSTEQIYVSAFPNMNTISFGKNVKVMPAYLYLGMNPIVIDIPSSVTIIPHEAFRGCTNLEKVNNVDNIVSIGSQAFYKCESLNSFPVSLNSALSNIGRNAFSGCENLTSITIPNSVGNIGASAFSRCGLCSIEWGNSIDTIRENTFSFCRNLVDVVIPNSVTTISYDAFKKCDALITVSFGNSLTIIGSDAFNGCQQLTDIHLPSSIRNIESHAFDGAMSLSIITNITCMANNPPILGEEVFGRRPIQVICVPMSSVEAYKTADGWSQYADVIVGI